MKRYIIILRDSIMSQWVWAENKTAARKQITPYVRFKKDKIIKIVEV